MRGYEKVVPLTFGLWNKSYWKTQTNKNRPVKENKLTTKNSFSLIFPVIKKIVQLTNHELGQTNEVMLDKLTRWNVN